MKAASLLFVPVMALVLMGVQVGWAEGGFVDSARIPVGDSPSLGPADAPVVIVEFSDYQCPYCGRAQATLRALLNTYPTQVRLVFKNNPLAFHGDADLAAQAALAAGAQGKFWDYHDLLFENQKAMARSDLEDYAVRLGLDMRRFGEALDQGTFEAAIRGDQALATKLGARGIPNFFINRGIPNFFINGRKFIGSKPLAAFQEVIDAELKLAAGSTYSARVEANFVEAPAEKNRKPKSDRPGGNDLQIYKIPVGNAPVKGSDDAPVTIIEFGDFQCPFCARVRATLETLMSKEQYRGKIRIAFKQLPLPFHKEAKLAAQAALAANTQGKFWEYHDLLFQNQKALGRQDLEFYASEVGLDMVAFRAALDNEVHLADVEADLGQSVTFGARGTPHFFINGKRLSGAQSLEKFEAAVDDALVRAEKFRDRNLSGNALYDAIVEDGAEKYVLSERRPRADVPDDKVWKIRIPRDAPSRGKRNAPITLVEFADFQCPFCARSSTSTDALFTKYGGKIRVVFFNLPLPFHKDASLAAEAAMAAHAQGKFWEYRALLFANTRALKRDDLERYAEEVGLKMRPFRRALNKRKYKGKVARDLALATRLEARGTPTFFINGRKLVGAQPSAKFEERIDAILDPAQ
jgi:protein-disulfide isomerase